MSSGAVETVTILITDLVGSTALESRVGPVVSEELRQEHFGLLREVVGEAGGREVKNTGDGLMVAFASAAAAVSCAVAAQQRFTWRNRSASEQLLIKVGISCGDASTSEGDVFGMPVIEAARLCDRCSRGQILAKELVAHLATGRGHRFKPIGALELKGLGAPLEAVEVMWEPLGSHAIALPERLREPPATGYVGREGERGRLLELWSEACAGSLRLALISGEAGVGKTRLATHLALAVHGEGATVLYGRCDEDLGVPYQPWGQALGHLVREAPQRLVGEHVKRFGGDLARLVPVLGDRVDELPAARQSDPETERYLLFAAVEGLLESGGAEAPLLLVLDDLHWAGQPTVSLLRHVLTAGGSMRVMVVGTYRDSDLSHDHPLSALLADLHRDVGGERIKLTGLHAEDVLALMEALAGQQLDEDGRTLAREITRETAGNPFFAGELLRHLREAGAIVQEQSGRWRLVGALSALGLPQSVREVIGRRIERLGADTRTALSAAAVIGRDFDLDLLGAVLDLSEARLLDVLDEAVTASLLLESSGRPGRFTFTHALVEHTLYEDLGRTRRTRLHRRVGEALEQECGADPGERLGELARHWAAAVVTADTVKATGYTRRAGERALAQLAPDEAARWYRQALELHDQAPAGDPTERCELLIGLGEAQRQTGEPDYRQTLLDAATLAQDLGDTDRLCRAVLANTRGEWSTASTFGVLDSERAHALEAAERAMPDADPRRAEVLALLACELRRGGESERCQALAAEAITIARAAHDPALLARTLATASSATWGVDTLAERQLVSGELVELVQHLDDPRLIFWAALRRMIVGMQAGDRSQVESALATIRTVAASVPEPSIRWTRLKLESSWALVQGDLQAAEQWARKAYEAATSYGDPDAATSFGGALTRIRYFQGRQGEFAEAALEFVNKSDSLISWCATAALTLIEAGRHDEARELLLAADFRGTRWDETWLMAMLLWAKACSRLRALDRAGELYELLVPFSGQFVAGGTIVSGSSDAALGALAATLERHREAERHFALAADIEERLDAPLFLAQTRVDWARSLLARGRPEDLDCAQVLLEQAEHTGIRLGAEGVVRAATECRAAMAATSG